MYLGGMAGTGKSQVIKAVTEFFDITEQHYRLAIVAPTGSAASLIGGVTYHSLLNINKFDRMTVQRSSIMKSRVEDIDYIILDEVSMLG